ncbi:SUKH-3 domain-containing protein [Paenibacillus sp. y28]|uniref:SUKH-3 domain-containing protein n=1 Tax=Paenibacillus sp. y28 TaxID=3129110 RepID=UPI003017F64F
MPWIKNSYDEREKWAMNGLTPTTRNILAQAGWRPDRSAEHTAAACRFLEAKGYEVFPCVKEALHELGGMEIQFERNGSRESFYINPEEAYGDYYDQEDFQDLERRLDERIILIGHVFRRNALMFMSESGKVYGYMDDYYTWILGDHLADALNNLCDTYNVKLIHDL